MAVDFFGGVGDALSSVTDTVLSTVENVGGSVFSLLNSSVGNNPNRLISAYRAQGIPAGAESNNSYTPVAAQFSTDPKDKDWRVRISCDLFVTNGNLALEPLLQTDGLVFPYLPTITMSHTANYETINTTHTNYPFYAYKNSQVDEITISGQFTVSDVDEGKYWLAAVHFLRTVTKMFFGQGPNLGNPPPICVLNGYGDFVYNNVPVVVKNFTVQLDKEVDYIAVNMGVTAGGKSNANISYVPVSSTISVTLMPVYSREKIKTFNLTAFSEGQLISPGGDKGFI